MSTANTVAPADKGGKENAKLIDANAAKTGPTLNGRKISEERRRR